MSPRSLSPGGASSSAPDADATAEALRLRLILERTLTARVTACETSKSVGERSVSGATLILKALFWWFLETSSMRSLSVAGWPFSTTASCESPSSLSRPWSGTGCSESAYTTETASRTRRDATGRSSASTRRTGTAMKLSLPPTSLYHTSFHSAVSSMTSRWRITLTGVDHASSTGCLNSRSPGSTTLARSTISLFSMSIEHRVSVTRASHRPVSLRSLGPAEPRDDDDDDDDVAVPPGATPTTSHTPSGALVRSSSLKKASIETGASTPHLGSPVGSCRYSVTGKATSLCWNSLTSLRKWSASPGGAGG
mmetsp:Transcript_11886/g.47936  ORF Transcript_11886/g.47936 Transcript_11886/m.47936 type:complete len:310 (+) Transcript_11886:580-1509(+)